MNCLYRAFLIIVCGVMGVLSAQAAETLRWGAGNNPPFNILCGKDQGTGYSDILQQFFAERMPEYDHKVIHITVPRLLEQAAAGNDYCYCNLRKASEREDVLLYSSAVTMGLAPRVYALKESIVALHARDGVINLPEILSTPGLRGLFRKGRSWGVSIDSVLRRFVRPGAMSISTTIKNKIDLVCAGRVDFFIEYPFAVERLLKQQTEASCLRGFKIKGQPEAIKAYVGCSNTDFGQAVIDQVNEIVRREKGSPEYREIFLAPSESHMEESVVEMEGLYDQFVAMDEAALRTTAP